MSIYFYDFVVTLIGSLKIIYTTHPIRKKTIFVNIIGVENEVYVIAANGAGYKFWKKS